MPAHRDDFDDFELFIKSTLSDATGRLPKTRRKIIHDDVNDEVTSKYDVTPSLNTLENTNYETTTTNIVNTPSNSHVSATSLRRNNPIGIAIPNKRSSPLLENLFHTSNSQNSSSSQTNSLNLSNSRIDNKTRIRLVGGLDASDSSNNEEGSDEGGGVIIVDDSGNLSDTGSDVMIVGSNLPSSSRGNNGRTFGSFPVDRFIDEHFPQWANPHDDLVIGPSTVKPANNNGNNFYVKNKQIIQPNNKDDDCVPLTPTETQECLWRESFLERLDYFLKCPICFRSVHKIGRGDSQRTPEPLIDTSRLMYSTKCGHLFCSKCIEYIRKKKQCPICRKTIRDKNQYHPLYP